MWTQNLHFAHIYILFCGVCSNSVWPSGRRVSPHWLSAISCVSTSLLIAPVLGMKTFFVLC